jgi:hypothetical protein
MRCPSAFEQTDLTSLLSLCQLSIKNLTGLRARWTPWSVFQDGSGKSLVVNAAHTWPCSRQQTAAASSTAQLDIASETTPVNGLSTNEA